MQSAGWTATARLLRRTGFGATGAAVDVVERIGIAAHVHDILNADPTADSGARRTPAPTFEAIAPLGKSASKDERQQRNQQIRRQLSTLTTWWIRRMVAVEQPFGEKLTFCWHNHFATAASKVRRRDLRWPRQNETLRRLGRPGDFRTLALAMLVDPAMLFWLDGQKNTVAGAEREPVPRVHGAVRARARRRLHRDRRPRGGPGADRLADRRGRHSAVLRARGCTTDGSKTVLGVTGNLDQVGFCDAVLARPASAALRASRTLVRQLVSDDAARRGHPRPAGRRLRQPSATWPRCCTRMLTDPEFAAAAGTIVDRPGGVVDRRGPGAAGADDRRRSRQEAAPACCGALGQLPFYPPNVSGWPSGQAWLSTAAADLRGPGRDCCWPQHGRPVRRHAAPRPATDRRGRLPARRRHLVRPRRSAVLQPAGRRPGASWSRSP